MIHILNGSLDPTQFSDLEALLGSFDNDSSNRAYGLYRAAAEKDLHVNVLVLSPPGTDEPAQQLRRLMTRRGFNVFLAVNSGSALEGIVKYSPEVVFAVQGDDFDIFDNFMNARRTIEIMSPWGTNRELFFLGYDLEKAEGWALRRGVTIGRDNQHFLYASVLDKPAARVELIDKLYRYVDMVHTQRGLQIVMATESIFECYNAENAKQCGGGKAF